MKEAKGRFTRSPLLYVDFSITRQAFENQGKENFNNDFFLRFTFLF